jgi:hypothetical protein
VGAALLVTGCARGSDPIGVGPQGPTAPVSSGSSPTDAPAGTASSPAASTAPGTTPGSASEPTTAAPEARAELPRGGRTLFPHYRLVGYAGRTGSSALGRLGIGDLDKRVGELEKRAKPYGADGRKVLPVLEVIATTVQASAGRDGKYRTRMPDSEVKRYLKVARKHDALLLLAIQPGRADFLDEVKAYDKWLAQPDVGVALDPEWAMGKGQVPGRVFGRSTGAELDRVAKHLSEITTKNDLPEKVMVFHELAARIVTKEGGLRQHRGVVLIKSVDGIGSRAAKENTYRVVNKDTRKGVQPGFKLFYQEDRDTGKKLMKPSQVLALKPRPVYVMYE